MYQKKQSLVHNSHEKLSIKMVKQLYFQLSDFVSFLCGFDLWLAAIFFKKNNHNMGVGVLVSQWICPGHEEGVTKKLK